MVQVDKIDKNKEQRKTIQKSRFYSIGNEWYISVRGEQDQGPFASQSCAEEGLKKYLQNDPYWSKKK